MIIEGIIENLIVLTTNLGQPFQQFMYDLFVNILGGLIVVSIGFVGTISLLDWLYIGYLSKDGEIKLFRKFPWHIVKRHAREMVRDFEKGSSTKRYDPTLIIGIGRGGAIFGSILSYYMDETPMIAIDRHYQFLNKDRGVDMYYSVNIPAALLSRVLLVAGEFHTGETMEIMKEYIESIGAKEVRTCAFFYQIMPDQKGSPYYYSKSDEKDYRMPWQEGEFLRTWKESDDAKTRDIENQIIE